MATNRLNSIDTAINGKNSLQLTLLPNVSLTLDEFSTGGVRSLGNATTDVEITDVVLRGKCNNIISNTPFILKWLIKNEGSSRLNEVIYDGTAALLLDNNSSFANTPFSVKKGAVNTDTGAITDDGALSLNLLKAQAFGKGTIGVAIQSSNPKIKHDNWITLASAGSWVSFDLPVKIKAYKKVEDSFNEVTSSDGLKIGDILYFEPFIAPVYKNLILSIKFIESDIVGDAEEKEDLIQSLEWDFSSPEESGKKEWHLGIGADTLPGYRTEKEETLQLNFKGQIFLREKTGSNPVEKYVTSISLPPVTKPVLNSFSLSIVSGNILVKGDFTGFSASYSPKLTISLFSALWNEGKKRLDDIVTFTIPGILESEVEIHADSSNETKNHIFTGQICPISAIPEEKKLYLQNRVIFAVLRFKDSGEKHYNFANIAEYKVNVRSDGDHTGFAPFGTSSFASKDVLGTGICSNSLTLAGVRGEIEEQEQYLSRILYRGGVIIEQVKKDLDSILAGTKTFTPSTVKSDTARALQRALFFLGYPLGSDGSYTIDSIYNTGSNMGMAFFLRENRPDLLRIASTEIDRDKELLKGPALKPITVTNEILQALFDAVEQAALNGTVYCGNAEAAIENLDLCDSNKTVTLEQFYSQQKSALEAAAAFGQSIGYPMTARWIAAISYTESDARPRPRFELKVLGDLAAFKDMGNGQYPFADFRFLRLAASSFGYCHVMGQSCGTLSWQPVDVVKSGEELFKAEPEIQFKAMVQFCKSKKFSLVILDKNSIAADDVGTEFSLVYNGKNYKDNQHHTKTANNYNSLKSVMAPA